MAEMYGSMAGSRTAGLVGHDEMSAQLQTWKGAIRVFLEKDGHFEVYVADEKGENGLKLIEGDVNTRTAKDCAGQDFAVSPLADKLEPIVVKNRGKAFANKQGASASPQQAAQARVKQATPPKPQKKSTPAPATQMPSQQVAAAQSAAKQTRPAGKPGKAAPGFDIKDFNVGDSIVVKTVTDAKSPAKPGTVGVIEKIRARSALGPQVVCDGGAIGGFTVFPNEGDVIEKA